MRIIMTIRILMTLAVSCGLGAAHAETNLTEQANRERPYQLETVIIQAPRIPAMASPFSQEEMFEDSRHLDAGHVAKTVPGISAACASVDTPEPSVRGLGWERVTTQVDFLPIYGSCPARMDPPTVYLTPESIQNLTVVKGLPSVTYGAGGTGGRVMARSVPNPAELAIDGATANASVTYNGGRDGYTSRAGGTLGDGTTEAGLSFNAVDFGDYESGDGNSIPGENRSYGAGASLRWTPTDSTGYWMNWNMHRIDHLDYPALPMDATEVDSNTLTLGSRHETNGKKFQALEWSAGFSDIDHVMDNSRKPNRAMMEAEAVTESQTFGGRLATEWNFSPDADWIIGADAHYLTRDALRERYMTGPGMTFYDPIWPDASQGQAGLFAERTARLENDSRLRLGVRLDGVSSDIEKDDEPLSPPVNSVAPTVEDAYAVFYGGSARDTDRNELLASGNILWEIPHTDELQWFLGAGVVQRAASVTERFYSFAPAPGGFLVGNPSLDPETKLELDVGSEFYGDHMEVSAQLFASHVWDYILETGIAMQDVNGDTIPDLIRGFENTDAVLFGGELEGRYRISNHWSIPFALAYVRGRDISDNEDLPLIPPLNGHVGIRWEWDKSIRPWAEAMLRAAMKQKDIDSRFPETETPGYQVVNLRGGLQLPGGFSLETGIENLFDQDYAEHLSRTAALPAGDLAAGEKIPMPGRYFYSSINWIF
jgi:iron complex outermembrane receptor protein